jgi:hypothetical protein
MNFIGTPRYLNSTESLVRLISSAVWLFPIFIVILYQVHINAYFTSVTAQNHLEAFENNYRSLAYCEMKAYGIIGHTHSD